MIMMMVIAMLFTRGRERSEAAMLSTSASLYPKLQLHLVSVHRLKYG